MPGVLIIESMAQTAAVLVVETLGPDAAGKVVYFMSIEGAKFRRPVVPGDQLRIHVTKERNRGNVWKFNAVARVDGVSVAEATYAAMIMDRARRPDAVAAITPKSSAKQSVTGRSSKHRATMIELVAGRCRPSLQPLVPASEMRQNGCHARHDRAAMPARAVIHPTAIVARGAELGAGVRIGPYCTVGADVVIEDGAELVSHVVVDGHTRIGPDVVLYPFCTVGLAPQDLKYAGQPTRCEIGARTQVREHCTIHRGTVDRQRHHPGRRRLPADGGGACRARLHARRPRHRRQQRGDGRPCHASATMR